MSTKRILSLVLALVMVLGTFGTVFAAEPSGNTRIDKLVELGLVKGDETGDLKLAATIRRDEVAAMVVRSMDLESVAEAMKNYPTKFVDVKAGEWNNGYVAVAEGRGITKGTSATTFSPERPITYAEVVTMLVRVLGVDEKGFTFPVSYVAAAHEMGILQDVAIANMGEMAVREKVFEMVFNTITKKGAGLLVANTIEGIVVENYRTENIAKDEIVVHVMKVPEEQSGSKYAKDQEYKISIDKELKAKGYDVETLLGKVVTIAFDKSGKVVDIKDVAGYTYVEGSLTVANSKEIKLAGKYYTVVKDEGRSTKDEDNRIYQAYYNNRDYNYDNFIKEVSGAEYAKATVRNGKVLFVEAFAFTDVAPVAKDITDKNVVAYYDDYRDGEIKEVTVNDKAYVINYAEKKMSLGNNKDIQMNDVIHYFKDYKGNLTVFVRPFADNKVEGVYKEANASKAKEDSDIFIVVDDEEYPALIDTDYRVPVYSTTKDSKEFLTLSDDYDFDLEPFEKKEVVLLRDMFGKVQLIGTQTTDGRFYSIIADSLRDELTLVKNDEEGLKGKGSEYAVSLKGTTFLVEGKKWPALMTKELQFKEYYKKDLVLVTATENDVEVLDLYTQDSKVITALNKDVIDFDGAADWNYISKSAVIFDVTGAPKATTVKAINDAYFYEGHPEVKGYIVENTAGVATVIVITDGKAKVDSETSSGYIVEVTRVRMRSDEYVLELTTADGKVTNHYVKGESAIEQVQNNLVKSDYIVEVKFLKGEKLEDEKPIREIKVIMPPFETYKIVSLKRADIRGEREVRLIDKNGVEETRWISRDALEFGVAGVDKVVAIREMDKYDRIDIVYVTTGELTGVWGPVLDKSILNATITLADAKVEAEYTAESWTAFQEALTAAKAMPETTQAEIDAKVEAVNNAVALLATKPVEPEAVVTFTVGMAPTIGVYNVTSITGVPGATKYTVTVIVGGGTEATSNITVIGTPTTDLFKNETVTVKAYNDADELLATITNVPVK